MRASTLTASYVLDWVLGDPEFLPHPVRIIGRAIKSGERSLRRVGEGPRTEFIGGALLTSAVILGTGIATSRFMQAIKARNRSLGAAAEIWF